MKTGNQERNRTADDLEALALACEIHKKLYERAEEILEAIEHENKNGRDQDVLGHHIKALEDILEAIETARPAFYDQVRRGKEKHKAHVSRILE